MYIQCTYILRTMYTCVHCVLVSVGGELGPPAVGRGEGGSNNPVGALLLVAVRVGWSGSYVIRTIHV